MASMSFPCIIQARMTSRRFPGKVLAPLAGRPLLAHVVDRVKEYDPSVRIVVATSDESADAPLAAYAASLGLQVVRGSRDDVLGRLLIAADAVGAPAFFRICADSPWLDPDLFRAAAACFERGELDLVTNVFPRTFPRGMSVELVRTSALQRAASATADREDREHATRYLYLHPESFRIRNLASAGDVPEGLKVAVDEVEDLRLLEMWLATGKARPRFPLAPEDHA